MEALYAKLYEKYSKLKTKKDKDMEELNRNQEEKFLVYASAADELIEHLRTENDKLAAEADELRSEVASARSSRDDQIAEYRKLLMEGNQKIKELSQEIERLQCLQADGLCNIRNDKNKELDTPDSYQVGSEPVDESAATKRKRRKTSGTDRDLVDTRCEGGELEQSAVRDSADRLSRRSRFSGDFLDSDQPECCKSTIGLAGGDSNVTGTTICIFQELVEFLVGMNVSIVVQAGERCISAIHQSSGYSFSLTWVKNSSGDAELIYRMLSLGTFERIAPEWMKEVIMFSTKMCPVFFKRVSDVVNPHHQH